MINFSSPASIQRGFSLFALSILMTVPAQFLYATQITDTGQISNCVSTFQSPKFEIPTSKSIAMELKARGFNVQKNQVDWTVRQGGTDPMKKSDSNWYWTQYNWWVRSEYHFGDHTETQAVADLLTGMMRLAQQNGFTSRIDLTTSLRLTLIDIKDPGFRRSFDLSSILVDQKLAIEKFADFEDLALTRQLFKRTKNFDPRTTRYSEFGLQIDSSLRLFSKDTDEMLIRNFKQKAKQLGTTRNRDMDLDLTLIAAEMLLRKGFRVEIKPSGRGTFVIRIMSWTSKSRELKEKVESVERNHEGIFSLEPSYYARNPMIFGVSDKANMDYSFNTKHLWTRPQDFETPSGTLQHEIKHIEHARDWLDYPYDEYLQSLNGFIQAYGDETLGKFGYAKYFQFDEITAAYDDMVGAENEERWERFHNRALDLSRILIERSELLRIAVQSAKFIQYVASSGEFLMVEIDLPSGRRNSGSKFHFLFRDLDLKTTDDEVAKRFLKRLDVLIPRLRALQFKIQNGPRSFAESKSAILK